jgi:hypothetical protein
MKINIITRTSNRPYEFLRCRESIINQTYKNINHVVICDNIDAAKYSADHCDQLYILDKETVIKKYPYTDFGTGDFAPYNLYFNEVHHKLNGWILYLDDDDYLIDNKALETMVSQINNEDTLVIFKANFWNEFTIPNNFENYPQINNVGGGTVLFHSKYVIDWDCWKCADFRLIEKLHKAIPNHVYIDKCLVFVPKQGFGLI